MTSAASPTGVKLLRSCDRCRKLKKKCDGIKPTCHRCRKANTPCEYRLRTKGHGALGHCAGDGDAPSFLDPASISHFTGHANPPPLHAIQTQLSHLELDMPHQPPNFHRSPSRTTPPYLHSNVMHYGAPPATVAPAALTSVGPMDPALIAASFGLDPAGVPAWAMQLLRGPGTPGSLPPNPVNPSYPPWYPALIHNPQAAMALMNQLPISTLPDIPLTLDHLFHFADPFATQAPSFRDPQVQLGHQAVLRHLHSPDLLRYLLHDYLRFFHPLFFITHPFVCQWLHEFIDERSRVPPNAAAAATPWQSTHLPPQAESQLLHRQLHGLMGKHSDYPQASWFSKITTLDASHDSNPSTRGARFSTSVPTVPPSALVRRSPGLHRPASQSAAAVDREFSETGYLRPTCLIYVILATACQFSDHPLAKDRDSSGTSVLGRQYFMRALDWMPHHLADPTPETINILISTSVYRYSLGQAVVSNMYTGLAYRVAQDLGLHQIDHGVDSATLPPHEWFEYEVRRRIWWMMERFGIAPMGWSLPQSYARVRAPKLILPPSDDQAYILGLIARYPALPTEIQRDYMVAARYSHSRSDPSTLHFDFELRSLMLSINQAVVAYLSRKPRTRDSSDHFQAAKVHMRTTWRTFDTLQADLGLWYKQLPPRFQVNRQQAHVARVNCPATFCAVLYIHTQYFATVISLNSAYLFSLLEASPMFLPTPAVAANPWAAPPDPKRELYFNQLNLIHSRCLYAADQVTQVMTLSEGIDARYYFPTYATTVFHCSLAYVRDVILKLEGPAILSYLPAPSHLFLSNSPSAFGENEDTGLPPGPSEPPSLVPNSHTRPDIPIGLQLPAMCTQLAGHPPALQSLEKIRRYEREITQLNAYWQGNEFFTAFLRLFVSKIETWAAQDPTQVASSQLQPPPPATTDPTVATAGIFPASMAPQMSSDGLTFVGLNGQPLPNAGITPTDFSAKLSPQELQNQFQRSSTSPNSYDDLFSGLADPPPEPSSSDFDYANPAGIFSSEGRLAFQAHEGLNPLVGGSTSATSGADQGQSPSAGSSQGAEYQQCGGGASRGGAPDPSSSSTSTAPQPDKTDVIRILEFYLLTTGHKYDPVYLFLEALTMNDLMPLYRLIQKFPLSF